jgi:hypothetical protein
VLTALVAVALFAAAAAPALAQDARVEAANAFLRSHFGLTRDYFVETNVGGKKLRVHGLRTPPGLGVPDWPMLVWGSWHGDARVDEFGMTRSRYVGWSYFNEDVTNPFFPPDRRGQGPLDAQNWIAEPWSKENRARYGLPIKDDRFDGKDNDPWLIERLRDGLWWAAYCNGYDPPDKGSPLYQNPQRYVHIIVPPAEGTWGMGRMWRLDKNGKVWYVSVPLGPPLRERAPEQPPPPQKVYPDYAVTRADSGAPGNVAQPGRSYAAVWHVRQLDPNFPDDGRLVRAAALVKGDDGTLKAEYVAVPHSSETRLEYRWTAPLQEGEITLRFIVNGDRAIDEGGEQRYLNNVREIKIKVLVKPETPDLECVWISVLDKGGNLVSSSDGKEGETEVNKGYVVRAYYRNNSRESGFVHLGLFLNGSPAPYGGDRYVWMDADSGLTYEWEWPGSKEDTLLTATINLRGPDPSFGAYQFNGKTEPVLGNNLASCRTKGKASSRTGSMNEIWGGYNPVVWVPGSETWSEVPFKPAPAVAARVRAYLVPVSRGLAEGFPQEVSRSASRDGEVPSVRKPAKWELAQADWHDLPGAGRVYGVMREDVPLKGGGAVTFVAEIDPDALEFTGRAFVRKIVPGRYETGWDVKEVYPAVVLGGGRYVSLSGRYNRSITFGDGYGSTIAPYTFFGLTQDDLTFLYPLTNRNRFEVLAEIRTIGDDKDKEIGAVRLPPEERDAVWVKGAPARNRDEPAVGVWTDVVAFFAEDAPEWSRSAKNNRDKGWHKNFDPAVVGSGEWQPSFGATAWAWGRFRAPRDFSGSSLIVLRPTGGVTKLSDVGHRNNEDCRNRQTTWWTGVYSAYKEMKMDYYYSPCFVFVLTPAFLSRPAFEPGEAPDAGRVTFRTEPAWVLRSVPLWAPTVTWDSNHNLIAINGTEWPARVRVAATARMVRYECSPEMACDDPESEYRGEPVWEEKKDVWEADVPPHGSVVLGNMRGVMDWLIENRKGREERSFTVSVDYAGYRVGLDTGAATAIFARDPWASSVDVCDNWRLRGRGCVDQNSPVPGDRVALPRSQWFYFAGAYYSTKEAPGLDQENIRGEDSVAMRWETRRLYDWIAFPGRTL